MPMSVGGKQTPDASQTVKGVVEFATKAETEAASDSARVAALDMLKNHPGVAKAWVNFNGQGTVAIRDSYNVSSITDNGTGNYTVNLTNNMANSDYCVVVGCENQGSNSVVPGVEVISASSFDIQVQVVTTGGQSDRSIITAAIFGELA